MQKIHIRVLRHSAFYSPLLSTMSAGFLREEGLEAEFSIADIKQSIEQGIHDGTVHLAQSAPATSFAYLEKGKTPPYVHFAQINDRDGFFLAGRQPDPDFRWQNLKGKTILVDHLFQPLAMFRYVLKQQGMDESDITIVNAGNVAEMDEAFRNGEGDYVHQQGPAPQQLEKDGIGHLVAAVGKEIGPVAFSSLCAAPEWLETDMAEAFMRAYHKAQHHVLEAPASQLAREEQEFFPAIDPDVLAETIATYQQLGCWQTTSTISKNSYETLLDVFEYAGQISQRYAYDMVIATPFGN